MAGKRAIKLKNTYDVTKLLARTINRVLRNEIEESKAAKVGYLANILLRALESSELESRVKQLEETLSKKQGPATEDDKINNGGLKKWQREI